MRIAFVEWPDALSTTDAQWGELKDSVKAVRPDILLTNEQIKSTELAATLNLPVPARPRKIFLICWLQLSE
jgi:hypothetical protein